jgi:hypothetical protein
MNFPATLAVKGLQVTHPAYCCKRVQELVDFYDGGPDFPIEKYLRKKCIEMGGTAIAKQMRDARVGAGFYTDYLGDCIDDLVSKMAWNGMFIKYSQTGMSAPPPYWAGLAGNTDGARTSATEQARAALVDDFVLDRAWYCVRFPRPDVEEENEEKPLTDVRGSGDVRGSVKTLAKQLEDGELDAYIEAVPSRKVKRWKHGADGELDWVRVDDVDVVDDGIDGLGEIEEYSWTFFTPTEIATYTARKKKSDATFPDDAKAELKGEPETHKLGVCPIFDVRRRLKCRVGNRLLPTTKQLFNEESDGSFYTMTTITGGIFIFTDEQMEKTGVNLTPFGGVRLRPGDKIERDKCDAAALLAIAAACAARRSQMSAMIYGMAKQSASQSASGQNTSRESGAKKESDEEPLTAFLNAFAEPHIACWQRMVDAIAGLREDAGEIVVSGLMDCEEEEEDEPDMDQAEKFLALPRVSEVAKDTYAVRVGVEMNAGEPAEKLEEIKKAPAAKVVAITNPAKGTGAPVPKEAGVEV